MAPSPEQLVLPAVLLGIVAHLGYFIRGEHHTSNAKIFVLLVFGPPSICLYFYVANKLSFLQSARAATLLVGAFIGSLTASILTYRSFFHPLRRFPGPKGAALSKWWQVKKTMHEYNTFQLLDVLHTKYGDIVRTGPNELSIIDSEVLEPIYGIKTKSRKSPWYDMSLPITSLQQLRDHSLHTRRRRQGWDKAFSTKSVRSYDGRVVSLADMLLNNLASFSGKPCNATDWFNFYSYDVMGSLGFGRSFDTLKTGGSHKFIQLLKDGTKILKAFGCVVYICNLGTKIPGSANPITRMNRYSDECVAERRQRKSGEPDILGHLIEAEAFFGDPKRDHELLLGDSRLVIVAGSDTTAAALTYIFYYIARDPSVAHKLYAELHEHGIRNDENFSVTTLQDLPYLNGIMYEGLRLHPPVPGGVFRTTPPEGIHVGEQFIPGNVNILVPIYSLQRSSKNFIDPNSFIPERWTDKPEMVLNRQAWMPFSGGLYACIGKQLAMNEIRTVISKVVLEFEVRMAPGEMGTDMFANERDCFVLGPGKLNLCFTRRGPLN